MRVIIAGSRSITEPQHVAAAMATITAPIDEVISGGAAGVDRLGEQWAEARGITVHRYPADWKSYGRAAGYRRNAAMALAADALVAIWDGRSRGTANMISVAYQRGLTVWVFRPGAR